VRIARVGGETRVAPDNSWMVSPDFVFETFASGPAGKINMIELSGNEVKEEEAATAYRKIQEEMDALIAFQNDIVKQVGKAKQTVHLYAADDALRAAVEGYLAPLLNDAVFQKTKIDREQKLDEIKKGLAEHLATAVPEADPARWNT